MKTFRGQVRGNVIVLEEGVQLPDGTEVEVRLLARQNLLAGVQLPCNPQGFEIRHRPAAAQVSQKILPAEHGGDLRDRVLLHRGGGPPAIQCMVIGVDPHGQRVSQPRHRVRRFQHLSGVQRMKVRIVVLQPFRRRVQDFRDQLRTTRPAPQGCPTGWL